jgi:predicted PurR-regulated permease PerM
MASRTNSEPLSRQFIDRVLAIVAIGIVLAALWVVADLILLVFGAILVALILRKVARPLMRTGGMGERWAVAAATVLVVALIVSVVGLFGAGVANQLRTLSGQLVGEGQRLAAQLEIGSMSELLGGGNAMSRIGTLISSAIAWGTTLVGV